MRMIRVVLAVILCRLSRAVLRRLGRGGTSVPGRIALKICPDLLRTVSQGMTVTVISGTNGKTTSARIIEQAYIDTGADYFANRSGANLLAGITAEFAMHASITGRPKKLNAIIECDEAALGKVCELIYPRVLLITNVFQDQIDRFGDVGHILECVRAGALNSPGAAVCLNADDPLSASLFPEVNAVLYGVNVPFYEALTEAEAKTRHNEPPDTVSDPDNSSAGTPESDKQPGSMSAQPYIQPDCCVYCGAEYEYSYITYAHLGGFICPNCGYSRHMPQVAVLDSELGTDSSEILLAIEDTKISTPVNLPGAYNVYNAAGAAAALHVLDFNPDTIFKALSTFECGFGRMERFELDGRGVRMILVKNPAGFNQVLEYVTGLEGERTMVFCLNDRTGDGTDISWINEVNFERLASAEGRILVSGTRADDMARRLNSAGIDPDRIKILRDYISVLDDMPPEGDVYIMPTYTAMLDFREVISKRYGLKAFWE